MKRFLTLRKLEQTFLFLCLIFLPTQLGKHFWPDFSLIFSLRIDYLSPTLYFWDILLFLLLFFWVLQKKAINKLALNLFLFFIFTQVLSLLGSKNLGAGLFRLEQLFLSGLFGVYLASYNFASTKNILSKGLVIALIIQSLIAISQFIKGGSLGFWILGERDFSLSTPSIARFDYFGQIFLRPYGTFPHPNVLAAFLVLTLPLIFFLTKKMTALYLFFLGAFVIFLTFSRSALLILGWELIFILRHKFLTLLMIFLLASPLLFIRFSSTFNFDNLSIIRRSELAEVAINLFLKNSLFGIGLNNFINIVSSSDLVSGPSRFLQPVHNIFLLSLSETGLIGFLGFINLIFGALISLWISRFYAFSKTLFFLWFGIIFLGMFDHYFLTLHQGQRLFFLIWGLSLMPVSNSFKKS